MVFVDDKYRVGEAAIGDVGATVQVVNQDCAALAILKLQSAGVGEFALRIVMFGAGFTGVCLSDVHDCEAGIRVLLRERFHLGATALI